MLNVKFSCEIKDIFGKSEQLLVITVCVVGSGQESTVTTIHAE